MGKQPTPHQSGDSVFLRHEPCAQCGSKDNLARYTDHAYCFGCNYYESTDGGKQPTKAMTRELITIEPCPLNRRKIREETCRKWGYGVGTLNGQTVQVANYRKRDGVIVAQKVRFPNKDFTILGESRKVPSLLYGSHLWPEGGKMIVVTEGELDALSVNQAQGLKWPCVSVPNGASGAAKAIAANLEYLESFQSVVFLMDQDAPGKQAAKDCADLLSPGKARIATLPRKDASEMLVNGLGSEIVDAIFKAHPYRPDGLVYGEDLWDRIKSRENMTSTAYPWEGMNEKLHGIRNSEMVVLASGTGIGKSSVCRELAHHLILQGQTIGYIALEESVVRSGLGLVSIALNRPVHLDHIFQEVSEEELKEGFDRTLGTGRVILYDHFGSMENDRLLNKIRQMGRGGGVTTIFLDHLSVVISAFEGGDERRRIDSVCTKLRQLVEELRISLFLVSHLRRGEGKALEEGGKTSINLLRGSAAIGQLADIVIGMERDQQGKHPHLTTVRCLKNRYSGETGVLCTLDYSKKTGRLKETTITTEETSDF